AASCGFAPADAAGAAHVSAAAKPEIALRRRLRCPSGTPSFSRSTSVRSGRISASISLARKSASYCPRPRLLSQSPTSIATLHGPEPIILRLPRLRPGIGADRGLTRRARSATVAPVVSTTATIDPSPRPPWQGEVQRTQVAPTSSVLRRDFSGESLSHDLPVLHHERIRPELVEVVFPASRAPGSSRSPFPKQARWCVNTS